MDHGVGCFSPYADCYAASHFVPEDMIRFLLVAMEHRPEGCRWSSWPQERVLLQDVLQSVKCNLRWRRILPRAGGSRTG